MKPALTVLAVFTLLGAANAAPAVADDHFEPVLTISAPAPGDGGSRLRLRPELPVAASAPTTGEAAAQSAAPGLPLIGMAASSVASSAVTGTPGVEPTPAPLKRYSNMAQAATDGLDPLSLRGQTSVLAGQSAPEKMEERTILQVIQAEWARLAGASAAEQLEWAKGHPLVALGGLAAAMLVGVFLISVVVLPLVRAASRLGRSGDA